MTVLEIVSYAVSWNFKESKGRIQFILSDRKGHDRVAQVEELNRDELAMAVDLLRNEKPVFYDTDSRTLKTGLEVVGEGE